MESDEELVSAVEREVLEEAGITARVSDVIGVRHAVGGSGANIYVVFRLDLVSGEPTFDGDETIGAGYFSMDEIENMDRVQGFSTWSIHRALEIPGGAGLTLDQSGLAAGRPGWSLFGLAVNSG